MPGLVIKTADVVVSVDGEARGRAAWLVTRAGLEQVTASTWPPV